jgi:drug/metabolite transporter (DMT)-like permease
MRPRTPARTPEENTRRWMMIFCFALIYLVWGSTFLAIRYAVQTIPPFLMMGLRHISAGAIVCGYMMWRGETRPTAKMWVTAFISAAFLFIGGHGILAWAELYVPSGLAALLISTETLAMVLLARLLGQEKHTSLRTIIGLFTGIGGVALLFGIPGLENKTAAAAVLLSSIMWAIGAIYARDKTGHSVMLFAGIQMLAGGVLLLTTGFAAGERLHLADISLRSALSLAFLSIFGSVAAYTAYMWLLQVTTTARVVTHAYVNPLVAVGLGWLVAREPLSWRMLAGALVIVVSLLLVNRGDARQEPLPESRSAAEAAAD